MATTFEEALAEADTFAAWDGKADGGVLTLSVFVLADGARQVAWRDVPLDDVAQVTASLRAQGVRIGGYDFHCDHAWLAEPDAFRVWSKDAVRLAADSAVVSYDDGREVARAQILGIEAFLDADGVRRGVVAIVEGGEQVPLVVERSSAAMSLPDYDRYDMLLDSAWTIRLAQALGAWLGVEVTATMP